MQGAQKRQKDKDGDPGRWRMEKDKWKRDPDRLGEAVGEGSGLEAELQVAQGPGSFDSNPPDEKPRFRVERGGDCC